MAALPAGCSAVWGALPNPDLSPSPDSNRLRHLGSGVVIGAIGGRYAIVASAAHALQARWNEAAFGTNWGSKRSTEVGMKHTLIALVALALSACSSYA